MALITISSRVRRRDPPAHAGVPASRPADAGQSVACCSAEAHFCPDSGHASAGAQPFSKARATVSPGTAPSLTPLTPAQDLDMDRWTASFKHGLKGKIEDLLAPPRPPLGQRLEELMQHAEEFLEGIQTQRYDVVFEAAKAGVPLILECLQQQSRFGPASSRLLAARLGPGGRHLWRRRRSTSRRVGLQAQTHAGRRAGCPHRQACGRQSSERAGGASAERAVYRGHVCLSGGLSRPRGAGAAAACGHTNVLAATKCQDNPSPPNI